MVPCSHVLHMVIALFGRLSHGCRSQRGALLDAGCRQRTTTCRRTSPWSGPCRRGPTQRSSCAFLMCSRDRRRACCSVSAMSIVCRTGFAQKIRLGCECKLHTAVHDAVSLPQVSLLAGNFHRVQLSECHKHMSTNKVATKSHSSGAAMWPACRATPSPAASASPKGVCHLMAYFFSGLFRAE